MLWPWILNVVSLVVGIIGGYWLCKTTAERRVAQAEEVAREIVIEAEKTADERRKEITLEAKEEVHRLRTDADRDIRERRAELQRMERRVAQKEDTVDRRNSQLERKEEQLGKKETDLGRREQSLGELEQQWHKESERVASMTEADARAELMARVEESTRAEVATRIREIETEAKEEADKRAREIVAQAIQKCAADYVAETTVSVVELPNDEMKGRIIGREGRNIRTLETLTGVDLIIDDTPEAVILSAFDPIRREVARIALEHLVSDGRIHPARIEEMVEKAQKEVETRIREDGEAAALEAGVNGLNPELIKILGRMRYRTSYGQNVLRHSIEVAYLAGTMAAELGADVALCRRAGLLHDLGKAIDREVDGPHALIGADLARKYKESNAVVHAIAAHHNEVEPETLEAVLVQAADAVSAARPGARRESLEHYIKRLEKLEEIADSFEGVDKSYAIQAGREIRIAVKPEKIDDLGAITLASEIGRKIEGELEYPGQIKVTVIRETRAVDYAK
jgi:ribonuclease Y